MTEALRADAASLTMPRLASRRVLLLASLTMLPIQLRAAHVWLLADTAAPCSRRLACSICPPAHLPSCPPAVAGTYAQRILRDTLGVPAAALKNCEPKPDFGGCHPDPNLTYAPELVKTMGE